MKIVCKCGNSQKAKLKGYKVPKTATVLRSNYCPNCENDTNDDYYDEWFENANGNTVD